MTVAKDSTSRDAFLGGRLTLLQPKAGPRTAIDAFFLAAAVPAREGHAERVLDAGTGNGSAAFALCTRVAGVDVTGVDIQQPLLDLAIQNAEINGFAHQFEARCLDVTEMLDENAPKRESFDHVMSNPPYHDSGSARVSPDVATATAYALEPESLKKWVEFLVSMVKPRGSVTLIHRADVVAELLEMLNGPLGALTVFPLFPKEGAAAKRVIVQGTKGSRAPLRLLPGMVLHEADGSYTRLAADVLREAKPLDLHQSDR